MDKWQGTDMRRNKIIAEAVEAADRIIMDGSGGSEEETNFLTAKVAEKFINKALHPFEVNMLKRDMEEI